MRAPLFVLLWALLCLIVLAAPAPAVAAPGDPLPVPPLSGRIVDQTGTLNAAQQASLEATLQAFEQRKGSQIAVLIVPTTQPESIEQFSLRVAEQWKLGRKKVDDGAILLVAKDDRALRIEVGYGLEGALNDATSKRIISEIIVPQFRQGDFAQGIDAGVQQMIKVVDGEPLPAPAETRAPPAGVDLRHLLPLGLVLAIVAGGLLRAMFGQTLGALLGGGLIGVVIWLLTGTLMIAALASLVGFVFILLNAASGRGMWWGGPGGGGGFGGGGFGGGGGGFSGGGGGFGGGGASGKW
ncbi:MAG: YgcG family protein [Burkholderiales bacterium]|nr:YgcG family protein [Burkholderiales bacterium]